MVVCGKPASKACYSASLIKDKLVIFHIYLPISPSIYLIPLALFPPTISVSPSLIDGP